MVETLQQILQDKIIAILRGIEPDQVLKICEALRRGGIRCIEITLNSPDAFVLIKTLSSLWKEKLLIGAGTVLSPDDASMAIGAGAKFIISPVVDKETISVTKKLGAVSIPGAYTPTEIFTAHAYGGDLIKVFPGSAGPAYIKEILAPLSHIPLMPTGGIHIGNIASFQSAGGVAFGIGKALVTPAEILDDASLIEIEENAKKFMQVVHQAQHEPGALA